MTIWRLVICSWMCLYFGTGLLNGQIPAFESNVTPLDQERSAVYQKFHSKYEAVIAYHQSSYGSKRACHYVFAYADGHWKLYKWSFPLNKGGKGNGRRLKKLVLDPTAWQEVLTFFADHHFYNLDADALHECQRPGPNGTKEMMITLDGVTHEFEVFTANAHRIFRASNEEQLQAFVFTQDREHFIACKVKLRALLKEADPTW